MSKATIRLTPNGTWLEIEAGTVQEMFVAVAAYQEVFSEKSCGNCQSANIRYRHRLTSSGKDICEIVCLDCQCAITFWPHKVGGTMFAKRDAGKNGWLKWERQQQAPPAEAPKEEPETPF